MPPSTRGSPRHDAELVSVRRHLHAHPELAFAEHETTAFLEQRLRAAGLSRAAAHRHRPGLRRRRSGEPVVVLRADIDALPLPDLKDVPYASTREGVCHACGHDVHTTVVLGVALALAVARRRCPGPVRCDLPARRGGRARRRASRSSPRACWTAPRGRSRCTATRRVEAGKVGLRTGADHRGLRPDRRHADRPRRAHRPAAAHRRPRLRPGPADHRPARPAVPPGRSPVRHVAGLGRGHAGIAPNAIPQRGSCAAPCGCWTGTRGRAPRT